MLIAAFFTATTAKTTEVFPRSEWPSRGRLKVEATTAVTLFTKQHGSQEATGKLSYKSKYL